MRVALITGPVPPGFCGVGDYSRLLAAALERKGVRVGLFESPESSWFRALRLRDATKDFRPDVTHIQYPTAGFGKGFTPQLFSLLTRFVLTLHEVEGRHILRKLSLYPLSVRAKHVIFTCEANREYSLRWAPWLRGMNSVIPLSSNIPSTVRQPDGDAMAEIVHFGLVRPNKGIDEVLEFARLVSAQQLPVKVRIIGSSPAAHAAYLVKVQKAAAEIPITWELNLGSDFVAERLAKATVAYMPFPEGASERHSSLLAALSNGLPVITTKGKFTPIDLDDAARFCATPNEAVEAAKELLNDPDLRKALQQGALKYAARFSWSSIADSHIKLYEKIALANS